VAIIDARQLENAATVEADVCIVGSGAAGVTLAAELEGSGARVCLLESGGLRAELDTQALCDLECVGYPVRQNYMARARYFGGTCNLWAGRAMRLERSDLEARSWVPNSEIGSYLDGLDCRGAAARRRRARAVPCGLGAEAVALRFGIPRPVEA
jgi:choline dehydrogenase-like flavoprotein